ncbi:MAG: polyhydroxybutyrate depolymerase [Paracoccaceae bacterium]|nr:polyhydroxybutyrate depolymerase [Paracoccaceae bacterium]
MRFVFALLAFAISALPTNAQEACGTPKGECPISLGFYRLALPEGATGPVPALVYLHGWGSSPAGVMRNRALRNGLAVRGYALIAPEGRPTHGDRSQKDWSVRDGSDYERDDITFLSAIFEDAAKRGVDRSRVLLAGFSRGGSMVWDVACNAPRLARAYAPIAGAFWEPLPSGCTGGADLLHTHGWADRIIPLEGRSVADGTLTQGDTFASLKILRAANSCPAEQPDQKLIDENGDLIRAWTNCPGGRTELWLHPGKHGTPKGWLARALDWFEAGLPEG